MRFLQKIKEAGIAVLAINILVWGLVALKIIPFNLNITLCFSLCSIFLILGQSFFIIGAEDSIMQMGQKIGSSFGKIKKVSIIFIIGFLIGATATLAEPDILFFVEQLVGFCPTLNQGIILLGLASSIGIFVIVGIIQIIKKIKLKYLISFFLVIATALTLIFSSNCFGLAFDASGVTTGPITVPLLIALGSGVSAIFPKGAGGGFGLVGIASIGPIIIMSFFGLMETGGSLVVQEQTLTLAQIILKCAKDSLIALIPIMVIFIILNFSVLKLKMKNLIRIFISLVVCYVGLVIFLASINYGFAPMGKFLGENLGNMLVAGNGTVITFIILAIIGSVLAFTEPAISILAQQINTASNGKIKKRSVFVALVVGLTLALILAGIKTIFAIKTQYLLLPILVLLVIFIFIAPDIFVAIAFDAGGVASGTMAVTFVFPIFIGIAKALNYSILEYAFGTIAFIAIVPIACVLVLGAITKIKQRRQNNE